MPEIGSFGYDNLISGSMAIDTIEITIPQNNTITRGMVLGRLNANVPATGVADGGNTGDGTLTGVEQRRYTRTGVYTVTCITAVTNGGVFSVLSPTGNYLPDATVGTAYDVDEIRFIINDGATDFIVGDLFTITVVIGSNNCVIVNSGGADDGRRTAYCIASEDVNTTATGTNADTLSVGYLSGQYAERFLTFGGTDSADDHRDTLRSGGIYLDPSVPSGTY